MLKPLIAECKYCKQMVTFNWNDHAYISEEDMREQATLACTCESAVWHRERSEKITAAQERIEDMLKADDEQAAKAIMYDNVHNIYDGKIYSINVNIGNGGTILMKKSKDNGIKLKRTDKEDREEIV